MSNPSKRERHATPATGVNTTQRPDTGRHGPGLSYHQVPAAPARRQVDTKRVFDRAEQVARNELRTIGELMCGQLTSFAWTLDGTIAEEDALEADAIATTPSAPRETVMPGLEHAGHIAYDELRARSSLTVAQLTYFLGALEGEDGAGVEGDAVAVAAVSEEATSLASLDRLMPGLKVAKQLARDELRAASRRMFAPFTSIPSVLNGLDGAGGISDGIANNGKKSLELRASTEYEGAQWPARADDIIDGSSDVGHSVSTYLSLARRRRLSSSHSLTPSPPPRADAVQKRERDDMDNAAEIARAAKHRRVETDTAAGSSRPTPAGRGSSAEPTHTTEAISTTAASAAVEHEEELEGCYDETKPATPPTRPACERRLTPRPPRSTRAVPCTFTVEFEAGRGATDVKQESKDDAQLLFAQQAAELEHELPVIHRDDAGAIDAGDTSPEAQLEPQVGGQKAKAGRAARRGKTKRGRNDG